MLLRVVMKTLALSVMFTFTACAIDDPPTEGDPETPTETAPADRVSVRGGLDEAPASRHELVEANTGGVPGTGCTIKSELNSVGFGNWQSIGGVSCGVVRNERVQVCVQWLVTGGWQTPWCQDSGYVRNKWEISEVTFSPLNYSPRWYRTRTWVSADGNTAALLSDSKYLGTIPE